jgi:hypothetical protein
MPLFAMGWRDAVTEVGALSSDWELHPCGWQTAAMAASATAGSTRHRSWGPRLALAAGGLGLAGSYSLVLPVFGVLSPVTWSVIMACWLWVIGVALGTAVRLARRGARWWAASWSVLALLATIGMWTTGWPQLTPEAYFRHHRHDLALLAADYRAGRLGTDNGLPWRLRSMSVDFQSHDRCGVTDPQTGRKSCALFLLAWQDWRAEVGVGFAYYPTRPGPDASLMTAAGDLGSPTRELGDGWWWVH